MTARATAAGKSNEYTAQPVNRSFEVLVGVGELFLWEPAVSEWRLCHTLCKGDRVTLCKNISYKWTAGDAEMTTLVMVDHA